MKGVAIWLPASPSPALLLAPLDHPRDPNLFKERKGVVLSWRRREKGRMGRGRDRWSSRPRIILLSPGGGGLGKREGGDLNSRDAGS